MANVGRSATLPFTGKEIAHLRCGEDLIAATQAFFA